MDGTGAGGVGAVRGDNLKKIKRLDGGWGGGRCIADNDDGGLCFEPLVGVVVVVVVGQCCVGFCGWYWCWWCWCRDRRQP